MTIESFDDLMEIIESGAEDLVLQSEHIRDLSKLGLDQRASYGGLWVDTRGEQFIAVKAGDDRVLQYYGGFEYIEKDSRKELGRYVFYMNESNGDDNGGRVAACFEHLKMSKMTPEELVKYREEQDEIEERRSRY